ncbi:MAG: lysylphosphatidylglycerol synthase transmembrane domain-containing protein [Dissulfurispiraceae bacterium]|jgi:glycosyltransferase 2 family protein
MSIIRVTPRIQKIIMNAAGFLISFFLLLWTFRTYNFREALLYLPSANYWYLLVVLFLIVINFSLRAMRWGTLFPVQMVRSWSSLFIALMTGYFANNILPARIGELVRVYVLGKREGITKSMTFATIVTERSVDLLVLICLLAVITFFFPFPLWLRNAGRFIGLVGVSCVFLLIVFNVWAKSLLKLMIGRITFLPTNTVDKITIIAEEFIRGASTLGVKKNLLYFGAGTLGIWFLETFTIYLIAHSLAIPLTMGGALFVMLAVGIGSIVPASPGNIGTYEFFAVSSLSLLHISGARALSFVLIMHGVTFLESSLLGAACVAMLHQNLTTVFMASRGLNNARNG